MTEKPIRLFPPGMKAFLVDRPNRFLLRVDLRGATVRAHMPNPGRMGELLLPGAEIAVLPHPRRAGKKTTHRAVAVRRRGSLRLLDTHASNTLAEELIRRGGIPSLRGFLPVAREVVRGASRFDLLLSGNSGDLLLEVKSCNLIERGIGLFPDAPTVRGRRHLEELAAAARRGERAAVLFLLHDRKARAFLPHIHTDLPFARTFHAIAHDSPIRMIAAAVTMSEDLSFLPEAREVPILLSALDSRLEDRGAYMILIRLLRRRRVETGALGAVAFPAGFYIYVGSAMANLTARIERHRRRRKKPHWHIDHLREAGDFVEAFPVRSVGRDECALARAVGRIASASIERFGSSDCSCPSHLFHFRSDPRKTRPFHDLLARFRHKL